MDGVDNGADAGVATEGDAASDATMAEVAAALDNAFDDSEA